MRELGVLEVGSDIENHVVHVHLNLTISRTTFQGDLFLLSYIYWVIHTFIKIIYPALTCVPMELGQAIKSG